MKLLDTSYLIDYSKGREPAREFYYEHRNDRLTASTAALAELSYGVVADQSRDLAEVREVFSWVEWLDVSAEDAIEFARIKDELLSSGNRLPVFDTLISGVARTRGATLVAGDSHFGHVEGLDFESHRE